MTGSELIALGVTPGPIFGSILKVFKEHERMGEGFESLLIANLELVLADPKEQLDHPFFSETAKMLVKQAEPTYTERDIPAPYQIWGEGLEDGALNQMRDAVRLPVSVCGALMPDAHQGYGLPIGGVLATKNEVIPYAVGVDIGCRMKLTLFDLPDNYIEDKNSTLVNILQRETCFGTGAGFNKPNEHAVLDHPNWKAFPKLAEVADKAKFQLGSSGSGNHFVEWGVLEVFENDNPLIIGNPGKYLTLLSHSGSRGPGAMIAGYYSKLAKSLHPELPRELQNLAWLDMDSEPGQEYWYAMQLMGAFASANHDVIHTKIAKALGATVIGVVENHHNFAWKEVHNGEELIVHRKGATPAGLGVLGVIPGSMGTPGFVVSGKGNTSSLKSASHGAGRAMSRTAANAKFNWTDINKYLKERNVQLLSAGLDENPFAYKDINAVMAQQTDLVDIIAKFEPRIVKM